MLRGLRRQQFDAAIHFSGSDRTLFWTCWMIPEIVPQQNPDLPIAQQRLRVIAGLGFSAGPLRHGLDPGAECLAAITPAMAFRVIQSRLPPP